MAIPVARANEGPKDLKNGYGEVEWLNGTHKLVHGFKCALKAGQTHKAKLYADKTIVYIFSKGVGYITTEHKAYNIDEEVCFFIPDFEAEKYSIYAVTDMEYMMVVVDMVASDKAAYENCHMILPVFKRLSQAEPYTQSCKGPHTRSWSIVHPGNLARVLIGVVESEGEADGTFEKGHPSVDQWNYTLPGADFTLCVDNKDKIQHHEGEWSYVKAGLDHQLSGKKTYYVWFEHKTAEIPSGSH